MLQDERIITFIHSLDNPNSAYLERVQREAMEEHIPIIRQEMQSFLRVFLEMKKPERILEVGAAVGFSSLLMAEYTPADCRITTIERDSARAEKARKNHASSAYADRIELLEGDALEIMQSLEGPYDFIFMDAAKGQYPAFLPECLRLLRIGGILISDNILQDGDILESHYAVERRNRTIYKRMRAYLYELKHRPDLITSLVPIGDGAAVTIKISECVEK